MKQADDLVLVSAILRGKSLKFWLACLIMSYAVWILKYLLLNILMLGFVDLTFHDHVIILGRHLMMWVTMLVSPAPGNAGTAELIFPTFFGQYLGDSAVAIGLLWRLLSYYPYLLVGGCLIPSWLRANKKAAQKAVP